jgi:hypothetical protein
MPELVPVTTASRGSLGTDVAFRDELLRARHVVALEAHDVVPPSRR